MVSVGVIAAAGRGTRLLPFSGFVPKEMIPLGTVPVIQYVVEELLGVGMKKLIVITDPNKQALINFFDTNLQRTFLESIKDEGLRERQRRLIEALERIEVIIDYQVGHYGNATPLIVAKKYLDNEPFFYTWADDFILASPSRFQQLADSYEKNKTSILSGVKAESDEDFDLYAYIKATPKGDGVYNLHRIHEKPGKAKAPSDIGVLSGHLFSGDVLNYVEKVYEMHNPNEGEFLFNTILHEMISDGHDVIVKEIEGADYIDTGNVASYYKNMRKFIE